MANYTTLSSDKSKKKAKKLLLFGGLGFHLFYVGRIKYGVFRFILSVLLWVLLITGIAEGEAGMVLGGIIMIILPNLIDYIKLSLGTFRDNLGTCLRG